ncbi:MAG: hypothetical protein Q9166_006926 [cf. Caloplaca sp. 2 TL-2023]
MSRTKPLQTVGIGAAPPVLMNIEIATEATDEVKNLTCWDGIIGMGFQGLNSVKPKKVQSYLERLLEDAKQNPAIKPTLPVFTIDGNPQRKGSKPSFEIGRIDREKANGDLQHAPVNNTDGWWAVENISFEVGYDIDHHPGHMIKNTHGMVFDTGGSGIIAVENATAAGYYAQVTGARDLGNNGSYYFPCESSGVETKLPDFKLYIGNGTAIYRSSLLKVGSSVAGTCSGMIRGTEIAPGLGNVGGAFFRTHFVVFDYETPAIQYAPFN